MFVNEFQICNRGFVSWHPLVGHHDTALYVVPGHRSITAVHWRLEPHRAAGTQNIADFRSRWWTGNSCKHNSKQTGQLEHFVILKLSYNSLRNIEEYQFNQYMRIPLH